MRIILEIMNYNLNEPSKLLYKSKGLKPYSVLNICCYILLNSASMCSNMYIKYGFKSNSFPPQLDIAIDIVPDEPKA